MNDNTAEVWIKITDSEYMVLNNSESIGNRTLLRLSSEMRRYQMEHCGNPPNINYRG